MTPTPRTYRTGFEQVFDCPAGRRILTQLRAATPPAAAGPGTSRRHRSRHQPRRRSHRASRDDELLVMK